MTAFERLSLGLEYPMVIATVAASDGERSGCLIGFHTQCSVKPPRWLVCVSKKNHTFGVALKSDAMAVHFPRSGGRELELAHLFGEETGDEVDKFARCSWRPAESDGRTPVLDGIDRYFVAAVLDRLDLGDHVGFVLDPITPESAWEDGDQLGFQSVRDFEPGHPP